MAHPSTRTNDPQTNTPPNHSDDPRPASRNRYAESSTPVSKHRPAMRINSRSASSGRLRDYKMVLLGIKHERDAVRLGL